MKLKYWLILLALSALSAFGFSPYKSHLLSSEQPHVALIASAKDGQEKDRFYIDINSPPRSSRPRLVHTTMNSRLNTSLSARKWMATTISYWIGKTMFSRQPAKTNDSTNSQEIRFYAIPPTIFTPTAAERNMAAI